MKRLSLVAIALLTVSCATAGGEGGVTSTTVPGTCPSVTRWAATDSVGHPLDGKTGWISTPSQAGLWSDLARAGATAANRSALALNLEQTCTPSEIVLEAGINDLAYGATVTQLEATITDLVAKAAVPVKVVAITPLVEGGVLAPYEAEREVYNSWLMAAFPDNAINCNALLDDANGWLLPSYSVDHYLHLTNAGYAVLGDCIGRSA
jgi:hypothetical protein